MNNIAIIIAVLPGGFFTDGFVTSTVPTLLTHRECMLIREMNSDVACVSRVFRMGED